MKSALAKNVVTKDTQGTEQIEKRLLVTVDNDMLHVHIPIVTRQSSSGRSTVIASTGGCRFADCKYQGREVRLNLIATYKNG
jgi:hypothetical protein